MGKKILLSAVLLCVALASYAERVPGSDTTWTRQGTFALNLAQTSLSNWSAGGNSTVGFSVALSYTADMKKEKQLWQNRFETAYGFQKDKGDKLDKTDDKLYLSSNYGYAFAKNWYASAYGTFQTQYANGYDDDDKKVSSWMSSGNVSAGVGLKWNPKPCFTATISPAAWRGVIVRKKSLRPTYGLYKEIYEVVEITDDDGNVTSTEEQLERLATNRKLRSEFGANLILEYNQTIVKNVNLYSRLNLYSDYLHTPKNIDVAWDTQITLTVNKWLAANIEVNMLYDNNTKRNIDDDLFKAGASPAEGAYKGACFQVKESLNVGVTFLF